MCYQYNFAMATIAALLKDPALRDIHVLAGEPSACFATSVRLVENLHDLAVLSPGTLAVLGTEATAASSGYKLDVNLRQAAGQSAAGLLLTGHATPAHIEATASALAMRSVTSVLAAPVHLDLVDLIVAASAVIAGSADEALRRADSAVVRLKHAEADAASGDTTELLSIASEALGTTVTMREALPGDIWARVSLDSQTVSTIATTAPAGYAAASARIVVAATAAAIERSLSAAAHEPGVPIRSRSAVLSDMLVADDAHSARLSDQAHHLGIPIDGWHLALMLNLTSPNETPSFDFLQMLGEATWRSVRSMRSRRESWHLARSGDRIVLIEMWQHQPPEAANRLGMHAGREVLDAARVQFPQLELRCGVGTPHRGLQGLRATVAEARAALAPHNRDALVGYDAVGLQPMLLEWYGTDTARQAVRELLTPLDELGGERAQTAISTLQAYLDEQGSLVRVAARLHLHRNAIVYRMGQIKKLLDVDLDDPDHRLAVQLACRARLLR